MLRLVAEKTINKVLLNKEVMMYNRLNNHSGEKTVLDQEDVKQIFLDTKRRFVEPPRVYVREDGHVCVDYPSDICKLITCDKLDVKEIEECLR